ncbi:MAG: hypothetical protein WCO28_06245 [Bacteroidota bacterium]
MKTLKKSIVITSIILAASFNIHAQTNSEEQSILNQINQENKSAIDAIAMYPDAMRKTIFNACQYPEIIVRLNSMQKKTNSDFTTLLSPYPKDEQEKIWNLTRYSELVSKLTAGHPKSESEINAITETYPKDVQESALLEGTKNYDLLVKIDRSNKNYNSDFEQMLTGYPPAAANVFKELLKQPGVLTILTDNMHMTIVVGDLYKKNPEMVIHNTDSINFVLTQKNKQDATDWQQSLETNPAAKQQYEQAAKEYAQENGYQSQQYYSPSQNDLSNYNAYPFNWWFGYPSWYGYSYWRPYPYWYDWGFYYGPGHRMCYYGMPSARFFNWYWYRYENHYRYAEFSSHCYGYYSNHREGYAYNPVCRGVHDWRNNNKGILGKDWDADNSHRVILFKEYGQMEKGRENYNTRNPQQVLSNQEYLNMNQEKYPTINAVAKQNIQEQNNSKPYNEIQNNRSRPIEYQSVNSENIKPNEKPANVQPQYNNPQQQNEHPTVQPQYNNPQQPVQRYTPQTQQSTEQPRYNHEQQPAQRYNPQPENNITQPSYPQQQHNAIEYHQNSWQRSEPIRTEPSRPNYQPAPTRPSYQPTAPAMNRPSFLAPSRSIQSAPTSRPSNSGEGMRR